MVIYFAFDTQDECDCIIAVYETYYSIMLNIAVSILHDKAQAEDVVQDVLITLADHTQRVEQITSDETKYFIATVTRNTAIDQYRRNQKRAVPFADEIEAECLFAESHIDEDAMIQKMTFEETLQQIKELPAPFSEVLLLYYLYELSCPEIAKILKIKPVAVRQRLKRARATLGIKIVSEAKCEG